jgi:Domain of unknown function (DUF1772)
MLGMLSGLVALAVAALFTGAALYINLAEQPARLKLDDRALLIQWQAAYKRGFAMQASLAVLGFLCGAVAWWQTDRLAFLFGALVLLSNWPYTLLGIMPINKALMATDPANPGPADRALIERWALLHALRTALGLGATLIFLGALAS